MSQKRTNRNFQQDKGNIDHHSTNTSSLRVGGNAVRKNATTEPDSRFSTSKALKFKQLKSEEKRIKIDPRFASMFTDKKFALGGQTDSRGKSMDAVQQRKFNRHQQHLHHLYSLADGTPNAIPSGNKHKLPSSDESSLSGSDQIEEESQDEQKDPTNTYSKHQLSGKRTTQPFDEGKFQYWQKRARGEKISKIEENKYGNKDTQSGETDSEADENLSDMFSGSTDSEVSESESNPSETQVGENEVSTATKKARLQRNVQLPLEFGDASARIAIVNCDWDKLKAVDIMVVCSSFCPTSGLVKSVKVYLSDFGAKALEHERVHGPSVFNSTGTNDEADPETAYNDFNSNEYDDDDETGSEDSNESGADSHSSRPSSNENESKFTHVQRDPRNFKSKEGLRHAPAALNVKKLRQYEMDKLKYYFAVVTCDSISTASSLYDALDNQEIELSSNVMDMRFVPDDVSFEGRSIKDSCDALPTNYQTPNFVSSVLQQTSAKLTWDETSKERLALTQMAYSKLEDIDESAFQSLIASASDSSDNESYQPSKNADGEEVSKFNSKQRKKYASLLNSLIDPTSENNSDMDISALESNDHLNGTSKIAESKPKNSMLQTLLQNSRVSRYLDTDTADSAEDMEVKKKVDAMLNQRPISKDIGSNSSGKPNDKNRKFPSVSRPKGQKVIPRYLPDAPTSFHTLDLELDGRSDSISGSEGELLAVPSKSDKSLKHKQTSRTKESNESSRTKSIWDGFEEAFEQPEKTKKKRKRDEPSKGDSKNAELELLVGSSSGSESEGTSQKQRKAKRAKLSQEPPTLNLKDSRFSAVLEDPRFAPDPTHPQYKKAEAASKAIINAKQLLSQSIGLSESTQTDSTQQEPSRPKIQTKGSFYDQSTTTDSNGLSIEQLVSNIKRQKHK